MREGNWTPAAEFNIWVDPEAARIVFRSGLPITMVAPRHVTRQALFLDGDVERLVALHTRTADVFADLLRFYARFHRERYGWSGSPIHDAVAVAHVALPGLVVDAAVPGGRRDDGRDHARPDEVVDSRGIAGPDPNVEVALTIDRERFARRPRGRHRLVRMTAGFG